MVGAVLLEKWQHIDGWPYSVSNHGNVRNDRTGKILKNTKTKDGYAAVYLREAPRAKNAQVHTLVAEAFLKKPFDGAYVNHIDGKRDNNIVTNLEYCSPKQNSEHSVVRRKKVKAESHQSIVKEINDILKAENITWQGIKDRLADYVEEKIKKAKCNNKYN